MDASNKALTNRSIRTIKTELEFLADSSLLTPSQLSSILALLPAANSTPSTSTPTPPTNQLAQTSLSEKSSSNAYYPPPSPAPPAYGTSAAAPTLNSASALYAYNPTDAGDLALMPGDRVAITEFMNADWAKGRNERTGQEGIFPRSYVRVEEKANPAMGGMPPPPQRENPMGYGNMPVAVSQGGGSSSGPPSKAEENGKKFGKKLGNAAIFGAGATIGGKIVNGIF